MFSSQKLKGTGVGEVIESRGSAEVVLHEFVLKYMQMSFVVR